MLSEFIQQNKLPADFSDNAKRWFMPAAKQLVQQLIHHQQQQNTPLFIGINGCQGSGKSTLASFLKLYFSDKFNLTTVNLSLDDFYYNSDKRQALAKTVHPLLATRGVPGTHDIKLLTQILSSLKTSKPTAIPRFNKAQDNPLPTSQWQISPAKVDIVIFEGWCWGITPQTHEQLIKPVNTLEHNKDSDGKWRSYVNQQLATNYLPLYPLIDTWLMLKAPSFDCVANWRWQQEQMLAQQTYNSDKQSSNNKIMSQAQVNNFISYFQRLTEHGLATLPSQCDLVFALDETRKNLTYCKENTALS